MRNLLIDLLFPSFGRRYKSQLEKTARSLIELGNVDTPTRDQELNAVLRSIASVPEALKSVKSGLDLEHIGSDDVQMPDRLLSSSIDSDAATEDEPTKFARRSTRATAARDHSAIDRIAAKSHELMEAIERAVEMLAEINNVSPLATTNSQPRQTRRRTATKGKKPNGASIDIDALDAFLVTANAGPLGSQVQGKENLYDKTVENDDETLPDADGEDATSAEKAQPDTQIWREIDQVIDQLVDKRVRYEKRNKIKTGFDAEGQADRARELLMNTDLRTNSAMTKAESKAMSHLYTQLFKLVKSDLKTTESEANSSNVRLSKHSSEPAGKTCEAPARLSTKSPSPTVSRDMPEIASLPPRYNFSKLSLSQHSEARTEEEQRKIRSYGFPPLPGSKVGTPRHERV